MQDPGLPLRDCKTCNRSPAASAAPTYEDRALGGLVLLLSAFACVPLFGIHVCLAPLGPDRELSLLLFGRTGRHITAVRMETGENELKSLI